MTDPWTSDDGSLWVTPNGGNGHDVIPGLGLYRATRLDEVSSERVRWLWSRRLPVGKLVTLDGDPDVGKSTLCLDLVARLTTGRPMPGESRPLVPASDVVLMAAEDGLDDTIRPRLDAAGADVSRVHHFDAVPLRNEAGLTIGEVPPSLPDHIDALEALVRATGAVLVVIDVLMAYLSGRADSHRDQDVRRALAPLADMAKRTGVCVLLLRHIPKSQRRGGQAVTAGSGNMGIIGLARAGMIAATDPADHTGRRRILARAKGNLAPPWRSLAYQLVCHECSQPACEDDTHSTARVQWLGESSLSGDQLLTDRDQDDERSDLNEAEGWLRAMLRDGPVLKREVARAARIEGIKEWTLKRAAKGLRIVSQRDDTQQGRPATWALPGYGAQVMEHPDTLHNPQTSDQGKRTETGGHGAMRQSAPKPSDVGRNGDRTKPS